MKIPRLDKVCMVIIFTVLLASQACDDVTTIISLNTGLAYEVNPLGFPNSAYLAFAVDSFLVVLACCVPFIVSKMMKHYSKLERLIAVRMLFYGGFGFYVLQTAYVHFLAAWNNYQVYQFIQHMVKA